MGHREIKTEPLRSEKGQKGGKAERQKGRKEQHIESKLLFNDHYITKSQNPTPRYL